MCLHGHICKVFSRYEYPVIILRTMASAISSSALYGGMQKKQNFTVTAHDTEKQMGIRRYYYSSVLVGDRFGGGISLITLGMGNAGYHGAVWTLTYVDPVNFTSTAI